MIELINSVRESIENKNWHGALFVAMSLPDICSGIESSNNTNTRYPAWFNKYLINLQVM